MDKAQIIILSTIWLIVIAILIFLFFLIRGQKKQAINHVNEDLVKNNVNFALKPIVKDDRLNEIAIVKLPVYFHSEVLFGIYQQKPGKFQKSEYPIKNTLLETNLQIFYYFPWIKLKATKFMPLGHINLIVDQQNIIIHHAHETIEISIGEIESLTIIWEKINSQNQKIYRPIIKITTKKRSYFCLFETYQEVINFILVLNKQKANNQLLLKCSFRKE